MCASGFPLAPPQVNGCFMEAGREGGREGAPGAESMPGVVGCLSVLGTLALAAAALPRISSVLCLGGRCSEQGFHTEGE